MSLKYCACHEKVMPGHAKSCHLPKTEDLMLQTTTPLRKFPAWPPNISDEHVSCTAPGTENACLQILFKCPTRAIVFEKATKPSRFAHFWQGAQSLPPATKNGIWTSKSGPNMWCFSHLDFERCFAPQRCFNISTCKSGPELMCFVHFDLDKCFAPQQRELFQHLNFHTFGPNIVCFVHFDFGPQRRAIFHLPSDEMAPHPLL